MPTEYPVKVGELSLDGRNPARVTLASAESWVQRNLPA